MSINEFMHQNLHVELDISDLVSSFSSTPFVSSFVCCFKFPALPGNGISFKFEEQFENN